MSADSDFGNAYDPSRDDARQHLTLIWNCPPEHVQWKQHLEWLGQFNLGPPHATEAYTSEQLAAMGMKGLYRK